MTTKARPPKEYTEQEVNKNYKVFQQALDRLIKEHEGEFVVIHKQKFIAYFKTDNQAFEEGVKQYGVGNFSVQEITYRKEHIPLFLINNFI